MFYARPDLGSGGRVQLGIPSSRERRPLSPMLTINAALRADCLEKVAPSWTADDTPDSRQRKLEESARALSKYIFPRQYNLANVFTEPMQKGSLYPFADYTDRREEIMVGTSDHMSHLGVQRCVSLKARRKHRNPSKMPFLYFRNSLRCTRKPRTANFVTSRVQPRSAPAGCTMPIR